MTRTIHLCLDIRGALMHRHFKGFQHDDGRPMTSREAQAALMDELAKGRRVLPVCDPADCPDFDYQTGCPGHPTATPEPAR